MTALAGRLGHLNITVAVHGIDACPLKVIPPLVLTHLDVEDGHLLLPC